MQLDILLIALNSAVAAILVQAGLSKLAAPAPLHRALTELGAPARLATPGAVRGYAVVECLAGVALLTGAGGMLVAALGLAVAALGVLGAARGSVAPCGCFGNPGGRPLGLTNAAIGLGLALTGALNLTTAGPPASTPGTAGLMLVLCLYVHRAWAWPLICPRRGTSL
jgi:hypothetical protein